MTGSRADGLWWTTALMSCAILIAGCDTSTDASKKSEARPSTASVSATSSPEESSSASTSPSPNTSSTPVATVPVLADGRYAARLIAVDSHRRLVTVDVVQFFLGKAAATAAAQDHAAEVPPPNDVWIRNTSHKLRALHVTSTAPITVNVMGAAVTGSAVKNLPVTLTQLGGFAHLDAGVFWLTVRHGVVTRIAEQYLP